jgi:methylase of polypeptide subunit release factors
VDFEGLEIRTDARVLTPRAWTAAQARWAAELAHTAPAGPILELCSGAGHIGLLAARLSGRALVAVDLNPVAGSLIEQNAVAAGVEADVRVGDMTAVLGPDELFPVVVADPPWVRTDEVSGFPDDPVIAIDGGADGLRLVRSCVEVIAGRLVLGGSAVLQAGPDQADEVAVIARVAGGLVVTEVRDYARGCLVRLDREA